MNATCPRCEPQQLGRTSADELFLCDRHKQALAARRTAEVVIAQERAAQAQQRASYQPRHAR